MVKKYRRCSIAIAINADINKPDKDCVVCSAMQRVFNDQTAQMDGPGVTRVYKNTI